MHTVWKFLPTCLLKSPQTYCGGVCCDVKHRGSGCVNGLNRMVGAVCGVGKIRSIVREFVSIAGENMSIVVGRAAWCAFGYRDWGRVFAWRSRSFIQKNRGNSWERVSPLLPLEKDLFTSRSSCRS